MHRRSTPHSRTITPSRSLGTRGCLTNRLRHDIRVEAAGSQTSGPRAPGWLISSRAPNLRSEARLFGFLLAPMRGTVPAGTLFT